MFVSMSGRVASASRHAGHRFANDHPKSRVPAALCRVVDCLALLARESNLCRRRRFAPETVQPANPSPVDSGAFGCL
jgi:hypothetical protein